MANLTLSAYTKLEWSLWDKFWTLQLDAQLSWINSSQYPYCFWLKKWSATGLISVLPDLLRWCPKITKPDLKNSVSVSSIYGMFSLNFSYSKILAYYIWQCNDCSNDSFSDSQLLCQCRLSHQITFIFFDK